MVLPASYIVSTRQLITVNFTSFRSYCNQSTETGQSIQLSVRLRVDLALTVLVTYCK